ncbi:MAG: site-specific integrase, partial [Planctomycetaceae bacterium]
NYSQRTIDAYTWHVGRFADFLSRSPESATPEDVRSFQLHLIEKRKSSWSSFNEAVCGLRFHFRITFPRDWVVSMVPFAATTIQKVCKAAAVKAGLLNDITPQALRA